MSDTISRLQYLLERYVNDTCTGIEFRELMVLVRQSSNEKAICEFIEREMQNGEFLPGPTRDLLPEEKADNIFDAVLNNHINAPARGINWMRWVAAACIIGLAVTGTWRFALKNNPPAQNQTVKKNAHNDFAPGKEGAILTLADGTQIILDSVANGMLASQSGVSVNKKDGQVWYTGNGEVVYNTLTTPRGFQYTLVLADGSKVLLNAASSIRFPTSFSGKDRVVEISGEAYFEVAKDANKKFVVMAGDVRTEVLGTHFSINSYTDEERLTVSLLEGSVKVSNNRENTLLQPGNQAQISQNGTLTTIKNANLEEATGWINGYFNFEKANVQAVMRQLVRWYNIDVQYKGKVTRELFGGKIQRNLHLSAVMDLLKTVGVEYKVEGKTLIIGL